MGEIKSAWEIAHEKADKLGDLSPEERRKEREDRCRLIGISLAEKYLSQHDLCLLEDEPNKHSAQDKELIRQAVIHRLIEVIEIGYGMKLDEIGRGILKLTRSEIPGQTLGKIKELFQEYVEAENKERQEVEKAGREILHQLRISGTAISQINIRAKEEWWGKLSELANPFEERLNRLKQELLSSTRV